MKYWFKNVADNIYIYPKSAPRNLILQTRTSDCNSAFHFPINLGHTLLIIGIITLSQHIVIIAINIKDVMLFLVIILHAIFIIF